MPSDNDGIGWDRAKAEIERIVAASDGAFTPQTIAQVYDFLALARARCPVAAVDKGYWATISFSWPEAEPGAFEVEVHDDHVETYRFYDRRTDIRHWDHVVGEPYPDAFILELPAARDDIS
jgi:hypothetical protein